MEWIRHNPRAMVVLAAVAGVVVLVLVWLMVQPAPAADDPSALGPGSTEAGGLLTVSPTPSPTATPPAGKKAVEKAMASALGKGRTGAHGKKFALPGLQGGTLYRNQPRHHVVLTVTSEVPIGTVGYIVPTSLRESYGVTKDAGTFWQLSTTAYGDPDYAEIFVQAGARGYPITCKITVDGRVTEQRSTEGPYGQMMCQG